MGQKGEFVDITHAGRGDYSGVIQRIIKSGVCPFCPDNFTWHKKPILRKEGGWIITESSWPYENAKHHFLIICQSHKELFSDLDLTDFNEVTTLVSWAIEEYGIEGGAIALRFGSTEYTGATVVHLHFHLIVPDTNSDGEVVPVWFPVG